MKREELQRLFELERSYWWFVGTRNVLERALRRALGERGPAGAPAAAGALRVRDVGSGSGIMLDRVRDLGRGVGLDLSWDSAAFCREKGHREMVVASAAALPFVEGAFDAAILADVVEHCPDDEAVLREVRRVLRPGGILLVSIPAFKILWSHHDVAIGHYRRYRRRPAAAMARRCGFGPVRATYFNCLLLPAFLAARLGQRLFRPADRPPEADYPRMPGPLNRLLIALLDLEARWLDRWPLPCGTSLLLLARAEGRERADRTI